jgi:hypothetical protein
LGTRGLFGESDTACARLGPASIWALFADCHFWCALQNDAHQNHWDSGSSIWNVYFKEALIDPNASL